MTIDTTYLQDLLLELLYIHSPSGYTDPVVRRVAEELQRLEIPYDLTRRGAIRARFEGRDSGPSRAVVAHLDTLGAMVRELKPNGRLGVIPIGTWSARFAEGARVSVFTDKGLYRGTILPLKASGHVYHDAVDTQPVSWDNLEVRVDEPVASPTDLEERGIRVGDFVGIDAQPEFLSNGYLVARHLDNKAGVASLLAALKALRENDARPPVSCLALFTISEEVGSGASAVLHGDVSEMVTIDNGTCAPCQASRETGVVLAQSDSAGPFDFHLTRHLMKLAEEAGISAVRDVFRHYRCDSASAVEAGNDIRTALLAFGVDASHGYERTHLDALNSVARLIIEYALAETPEFEPKRKFTDLEHFPTTRKTRVDAVTLPGVLPVEEEADDADEK